jgi:SAM-dependent methyltransferase
MPGRRDGRCEYDRERRSAIASCRKRATALTGDSLLDSATIQEISRLFLPNRWHYHYARIKLAMDPVYAVVTDALGGTHAPLLDLGCGVGLLPHYAQARGISLEYLGVDNDVRKLALARAVAVRGALRNARFETVDLAQGFPEHRGSVAILDLLQFLPVGRVADFLALAADCVSAEGRLIIRTGLNDGGWRTRLTRAADHLARAIRWMNAGPRSYPTREFLVKHLEAQGLELMFTPLWCGTPFNNWLIVARRS